MKKEYSFFRFAWKYFRSDVYKIVTMHLLSCIVIIESFHIFWGCQIFFGLAWIGFHSQVDEYRKSLITLDKSIEESEKRLADLRSDVFGKNRN